MSLSSSSIKAVSYTHLTIPSDTVCYPAKLLHGHVEALVEEGVDAIWYPCMSYNNDEGIGDNHYNCPVVAYYPELLAANVPALKQTRFLDPYVGLWRHKDFTKRISVLMEQEFGVPKKETKAAAQAAYTAYENYVDVVRETGKESVSYTHLSCTIILISNDGISCISRFRACKLQIFVLLCKVRKFQNAITGPVLRPGRYQKETLGYEPSHRH